MTTITEENTSFSSLKSSLLFLQTIDDKFLLCLPSYGPDLSICGGRSFKELIQKITDTELQMLLTTILTGSTKYIGEEPKGYIESTSRLPMPAFETYKDYEKNYEIILSMHTRTEWNNNFINLIKDDIVTQHLNIPHDKYRNLSDALTNWEKLLKYIISKKEKNTGALPYSYFIKNILPLWIIELYEENLKLPELKIATIRCMGKLIAELNGYIYEAHISSINRKGGVLRDIFYNNEQQKYISIDITHGRFEVLDNSGKHVNEIDFYGNITKKRDRSGKHNILLS